MEYQDNQNLDKDNNVGKYVLNEDTKKNDIISVEGINFKIMSSKEIKESVDLNKPISQETAHTLELLKIVNKIMPYNLNPSIKDILHPK